MPEPSISVDRAVGHYVRGIDVDMAALNIFYSGLPHPHKPPLEDCHIHFSALAQVDRRIAGRGACIRDREYSQRLDPQAPPSNIMLFLGSFCLDNSMDQLDETLKHELAHYAQAQELQPPSEQRHALEVELQVMTGKIAAGLFMIKAALAGVAFEAAMTFSGEPVNIGVAGSVGFTIAVLSSLVHRKKRKQKIVRIEEELFRLDRSAPHERDADSTAGVGSPIVHATQRVTQKAILERSRRKSSVNRLFDALHKQYSLMTVNGE